MTSYDSNEGYVPQALEGTSIVVDKDTNVAVCHATHKILSKEDIYRHCKECSSCEGFDKRKIDSEFHQIRNDFDNFEEVVENYFKRLFYAGYNSQNLSKKVFPQAIAGCRTETRRTVLCLACFEKDGKLQTSYGQNFEGHCEKAHYGQPPKFLECSVMKYRYEKEKLETKFYHMPFSPLSTIGPSVFFGKSKMPPPGRNGVQTTADKPKGQKFDNKFEPLFKAQNENKERKVMLVSDLYYNACFNATARTPAKCYQCLAPQPTSTDTGKRYRTIFQQMMSLFARAQLRQQESLLGLSDEQKQGLRNFMYRVDSVDSGKIFSAFGKKLEGSLDSNRNYTPLNESVGIPSEVSMVKVRKASRLLEFFDYKGELAKALQTLHVFLTSMILDPRGGAGNRKGPSTSQLLPNMVSRIMNLLGKKYKQGEINSGIQFIWHLIGFVFGTSLASNLSREDRLELIRNILGHLVIEGGFVYMLNGGKAAQANKRRRSSGSSGYTDSDSSSDIEFVSMSKTRRKIKLSQSPAASSAHLSPVEQVDSDILELMTTIVDECMEKFGEVTGGVALRASSRFANSVANPGTDSIHDYVSRLNSNTQSFFQNDHALKVEMVLSSHSGDCPETDVPTALLTSQVDTQEQVSMFEQEMSRISDLTNWLILLVRLSGSTTVQPQVPFKWETSGSGKTNKPHGKFVENKLVFSNNVSTNPTTWVPWIVAELVTRYVAVVRPYYLQLAAILGNGRGKNLSKFELTSKHMSYCTKRLFGTFQKKYGTTSARDMGNGASMVLFDSIKDNTKLTRKLQEQCHSKLRGTIHSEYPELGVSNELTDLGQKYYKNVFMEQVLVPFYV